MTGRRRWGVGGEVWHVGVAMTALLMATALATVAGPLPAGASGGAAHLAPMSGSYVYDLTYHGVKRGYRFTYRRRRPTGSRCRWS